MPLTPAFDKASGGLNKHLKAPPLSQRRRFLQTAILAPYIQGSKLLKPTASDGFFTNASDVVWGREQRRNMHTRKIHRLVTKFTVSAEMGASGTHFWKFRLGRAVQADVSLTLG